MAISGNANAITITIDLDNATLEELQYTKQMIDSKLNVLIARNKIRSNETTLKYEKLAMTALTEFTSASWKNPSNIDIDSIMMITFPEGFNKEYTYTFDEKTSTKTILDRSILFGIEYTEQALSETMIQSDYFYVFIHDTEKYLKAKEEGNKLIEKLIVSAENKEEWVEPLFYSVYNGDDDYQLFMLDRDYLITAYNNR